MHQFSEHSVNCLQSYRLRLPNKIPSGSVIVVTVQPKIPFVLRDNLAFSLALLLVLFNPILVNPIHELVYIGDRFPNQRLS